MCGISWSTEWISASQEGLCSMELNWIHLAPDRDQQRAFVKTVMTLQVPFTRIYPKFSDLAAWSENCKWYSSLPIDTVVSLFLSQSSEFCLHIPLCCLSPVYYFLFRYRLSPENFRYNFVLKIACWIAVVIGRNVLKFMLTICFSSHDSSVSIVMKLLAGQAGLDFRQEKWIVFSPSLHHPVQAGSGAHPTSYLISTGGKAAGAWSWPFTSV